MRRTATILAALTAGALVPCAGADPELWRVLVHADLTEQRVQLVSLDGQGVSFVDQSGLERRLSSRDVLAIYDQNVPWQGLDADPVISFSLDSQIATFGEPGVLVLTDGQRLMGRPAQGPISDEGAVDGARWSSEQFGDVVVSLELVAGMRRAPLSSPDLYPATPEAEDSIDLANGDHATGFVAWIATNVRIESDDAFTLDVPVGRVRGVRLSNPLVAPAGARVWLADGSAVRITDLHTDRTGRLRLSPHPLWAGAEGESFSLGEVSGLVYECRSYAALGWLPSRTVTVEGDRVWTPPPEVSRAAAALDVPDVVLPGPMMVRWEIPSGASAIAFGAELPEAMRTWGDCELIVRAIGAPGPTEIFRATLNADTPEASCNTRLPACRSIEFELTPGRFGPVQDRVRLIRPVLRIEAPDTESTGA